MKYLAGILSNTFVRMSLRKSATTCDRMGFRDSATGRQLLLIYSLVLSSENDRIQHVIIVSSDVFENHSIL